MSGMFKVLIGNRVKLQLDIARAVSRVFIDPTHLERTLLNLVLNARDAMPRGGKLSIETSNVYLDEAYAREHVSVVPGDYVMLAISDTGCGMSEETRRYWDAQAATFDDEAADGDECC